MPSLCNRPITGETRAQRAAHRFDSTPLSIPLRQSGLPSAGRHLAVTAGTIPWLSRVSAPAGAGLVTVLGRFCSGSGQSLSRRTHVGRLWHAEHFPVYRHRQVVKGTGQSRRQDRRGGDRVADVHPVPGRSGPATATNRRGRRSPLPACASSERSLLCWFGGMIAIQLGGCAETRASNSHRAQSG